MDDSREAIAARLSEYFRRQTLGQGEFGKLYGLGNQSNVGHYLHARRPMSYPRRNQRQLLRKGQNLRFSRGGAKRKTDKCMFAVKSRTSRPARSAT